MRRSVQGEVYSSTFDRSAKQHIALAELVIERASAWSRPVRTSSSCSTPLTRLCRATHNNATSSGGRAAQRRCRRRGAARAEAVLRRRPDNRGGRFAHHPRHRPGGDRLACRRLLLRGAQEHREHGTAAEPGARLPPGLPGRGDDRLRHPPRGLLLSAAESTAVRRLRRRPWGRDEQSGLETLLERMRRTPDNATFLRRVQPTLPTD